MSQEEEGSPNQAADGYDSEYDDDEEAPDPPKFTCASCGKEEEKVRRCGACKAVHYCNAACQRNHRSVHKEECKRIEQELKIEGGFIRLQVLSKEERREEFERMCEYDSWIRDCAKTEESEYMDPLPKDLTELTPMWQTSEFCGFDMKPMYNSVEEALKECGDEYTRDELEREVSGWEEMGFCSLEDACMQSYDARSIEEAIWDGIAVPRIRIIFPLGATKEEEGKLMKKAGWKWLGYKPKDIYPNEKGMIRGQRVAGGYGDGWKEKNCTWC